MIAQSVLLRICIVCMRRTEHITHVFIVRRMLIRVLNNKPNRASRRLPFKHTRQDFNHITFLASGSDMALPWSATVQFALDKIQINFQPSRKSVNHSTNTRTMTFTESGQREYVAEYIPHTHTSINGNGHIRNLNHGRHIRHHNHLHNFRNHIRNRRNSSC